MTSILWDMGGTLFDTYPYIDSAFHRLVESHGISIGEVSRLTRVNRGHAIETLSARTGIPASSFEEAYDAVKENWVTDPAPLMEGAEELVKACRHGRGRNIIVTHRDRQSAEQLISTTGLTFDDLITTSDGYPRKPDPAMILEVMERNNLVPGDCIAIGDRAIDCEAALAAGVTPVLLVNEAVDSGAAEYRRISRLTELLPLFAIDAETPVNPWAERG